MKTLLSAIFALFTSLNPAFAVVAVTACSFLVGFQWLNSQWTVLLNKLDLLVAPSALGVLNVQPLGFLNTFAPITETLTMFTLWLAVLFTCIIIRVIKSFIPTVAT